MDVLRAIARRQHALVSWRQAREAGFSRKWLQRKIASGALEWALPGLVLRIAGAPTTWRSTVMAAVLAGGPGSAASHRTAAALWKLDGASPGIIEITVPRNRRLVIPGVVVHRKKDLQPVDVTATFDGIPVTTPARTLVDCGAVWPARQLQEALDFAVREGLCSLARVIWRVSQVRRRGRNGISTIVEVLLTADGRVRSVLERRFLRVMHRFDLPGGRRQYEVHDRGRLVAKIDFAFPELKVAIEVTGHGTHSTRAQRRRDNRRRNELELLGWRVFEFTYEQVCFEPAYVAATVRQALGLVSAA